MVALLFILTFAALVLVDHLVVRQPIVLASDAEPEALRPRMLSPLVAGFRVPDNLRYHQGHTWALAESPELVRVGADDFTAKLAGKLETLTIPERGQWIRQGQRIISMTRDGHELDLVSPIEGTVVDVNEAALRNPELLSQDCYGEGWLITVNSPDAKTNFKNLLSGRLARRWMEDSAAKLRTFAMPSVAMAQDGGVAVNDVLEQLPAEKWAEINRDLFMA